MQRPPTSYNARVADFASGRLKSTRKLPEGFGTAPANPKPVPGPLSTDEVPRIENVPLVPRSPVTKPLESAVTPERVSRHTEVSDPATGTLPAAGVLTAGRWTRIRSVPKNGCPSTSPVTVNGM